MMALGPTSTSSNTSRSPLHSFPFFPSPFCSWPPRLISHFALNQTNFPIQGGVLSQVMAESTGPSPYDPVDELQSMTYTLPPHSAAPPSPRYFITGQAFLLSPMALFRWKQVSLSTRAKHTHTHTLSLYIYIILSPMSHHFTILLIPV